MYFPMRMKENKGGIVPNWRFMIKEIIVVEGRDDEAAIKRAIEAETIATHGFGIKAETFKRIEKAYAEKGIIIFTDQTLQERK